MAKTKTSEIAQRTEAELRAEVSALREQLFKLRWQAAAGQVENPMKIRHVRKDIARNLTVLRQRELAARRGGETS